MPIYKTTHNILNKPWEDELFNENWMDHDLPYAPPTQDWKYDREMRLEDVEIWEEIYYKTGGIGLYAAYLPYAEFYMITGKWVQARPGNLEFFYGPGSMQAAYHRALALGMPIQLNQQWCEPIDLWLFEPTEPRHEGNVIITD